MQRVDKLTQMVESRTPLNASKLGAKLGHKACAQEFQERGWHNQAEMPLPTDEAWSRAFSSACADLSCMDAFKFGVEAIVLKRLELPMGKEWIKEGVELDLLHSEILDRITSLAEQFYDQQDTG